MTKTIIKKGVIITIDYGKSTIRYYGKFENSSHVEIIRCSDFEIDLMVELHLITFNRNIKNIRRLCADSKQ